VVEALVADHLPLGAFEGEAKPAVAMVGMDAHHVRAMFGARTVGRGLQPGEAEDEADQLIFGECAQHQSAVVDGGDEHVRGHHVGFAARPDDALQFFDGGHLFGSFDQADGGWHIRIICGCG
jgi:hypothetical protein